jgi:competence protein ComEA
MMERCRRLILFLAATLASAPLFIKGRAAVPQNGGAPFLPLSTAGLKVRLGGAVRSPGVYAFAPGTDLARVIKLTSIDPSAASGALPHLCASLTTGTSLEIPFSTSERAEITLQKMHARERLLLGIPLDPDQMDRDDWCSVPGIGPALAERIVRNRQIYGEFHTAESLKRVPGIGDKKLSRIKKYFIAM